MADTVKEKLVELIVQGNIMAFGRSELFDEIIADNLIAHGVTMREWIPVTESLPKPFVSVLVQMPEEAPCPTVREGFITDKGIWHSAWYDREPDEVTHWMPMPEPPKGE